MKLFTIAGLCTLLIIALAPNNVLAECDVILYGGTATVDGDNSEWNHTTTLPSGEMYQAWKPENEVLSKFWLRYNCDTETMYILVMAENTIDVQNGTFVYVKLDGDKVVSSSPEGAQEFSWVGLSSDEKFADGWEASFPLTEGTFTLEIHNNAYDDEGKRQSAGLEEVQLCVDCAVIGIELNSFEAYACEQGVMLEWNVAAEINHAGYNIYRAERDGEYAKINAELISAPLGRGSRQYEYLDNVQPGIYFYRLEDVSLDGESAFYGPIQAASLTQVTNASDVPTTYSLSANYPNPFNPATTISYTLPEQSEIQLTIYDVHGKQIKNLASGLQFAGTYAVTWDGTNDAGDMVASGTYLYRLVAGDVVKTARMTLLK